MMIPRLSGRENFLERRTEVWRPPNFQASATRIDRCIGALRRFFDLQAASIWNDLWCMLPHCEGSVLDVGCGAQPYRLLLRSGIQYLGIDTADARDRFGYQVADTLYFSGERWPIDANTMDVVLATETLEHVAAPDQFLAEARRCLKSSGHLILTVPFAARWHYIPHDYWRFTPSGIRLLLTQAGFSELVVYARGNEITVLCYKVMAPILTLLLGSFQSGLIAVVARMCGALLFPILILMAFIGQLSLRLKGGNDCLGYTVVACATAIPTGAGA